MGLFGKKSGEEGYIITPNIEDSRYSQWVEQARQAKNPNSLTPEQLLGELNTDDDINENIIENVNDTVGGDIKDNNDEYVLDSAEVFEAGTSKSLYAKMLSFLDKDKKPEPQPDEETNLPEQIVETKEKKVYDSSKDEFADFFRSLEAETAPNKVSTFDEGDKAYAEPEKEVEVETKEDSIDDLLSRIFGTSKAEPVEEAIEINKPEENPQIEQLIAEVEEEIVQKEEIPKKEQIDQDIKIAEEVNEVQETLTEAPVEQEVVEEVAESEEEIEKTKFINIPEATLHAPKHSLYKKDYTINRKAIDDFFDGNEVVESETVQEEEYVESITDVFSDETDDYQNLDDAARFKNEFLKKRRGLTTRLIITIVLTILMAIVNNNFLGMKGFDLGTLPNVANLVMLVAVMIINISSLANIFKDGISSDLCTNVTGLVVLIQSAVSIALFDGNGAGLGALAGLAYCTMLIAKRAVCSAKLKSLCVVATNEQKYAVNLIEDSNESKDITGNIFEDEIDTCLCYSKKTINVMGFLKNWERKNPSDKNSGVYLVVATLIAVLVTIFAFFMVSTETSALLTIFVIGFCLGMAPSLHLPYSLPTKVMTDGLKYYNSAIGGWNAATALSNCNCVAVKAADLFPAGSIVLHKMNPLSANPIDSSIAKAAALTIKAESPLANIFKDILNGQPGELPKVEDVKYENKLGISGWVDNQIVLIGNRTLLENHNVKTPSIDSEKAILSAGFSPVYLAIGGIPCLLFVVQYVADPNVKYELCRLCNTNTTVVINTTDPNVTKKLICEKFDLLEESVEMIGRNGLNNLRNKTKPEESTNGFAVYKDNPVGFLAVLSSAIRVMGVKTMMQVFHIIGIILTLAAFVFLLYSKGLIATALLLVLIFQVLFVGIISAIPYINRP